MTNKILSCLSVAAVLFFLTLTGCSKKSSNPVDPTNSVTSASVSGSVTLNGGDYSNTVMNYAFGAGGYSTNDQSTACVMYATSGTDSLYIVVSFAGSSTGNYQWQGFTEDSLNYYIDGVGISVYKSNGSYSYLLPQSGGNTNITKYGAVGETIEGSFSGTLQDPLGSTTVTVSGSFKVVRAPDN